jgi:hypothetical protein
VGLVRKNEQGEMVQMSELYTRIQARAEIEAAKMNTWVGERERVWAVQALAAEGDLAAKLLIETGGDV